MSKIFGLMIGGAAQGPTGPAGATGPQGEAGPAGPAGASSKLVIAKRITSNLTISMGGFRDVIWNSAVHDPDSMLNTTTGVVTVPASYTGNVKARITAHCLFNNGITGRILVFWGVKVQSSVVLQSEYRWTESVVSGDNTSSPMLSADLVVSPSDTILLQLYCTTHTLVMLGSPQFNNMSIEFTQL